jgi:hypothetical protein
MITKKPIAKQPVRKVPSKSKKGKKAPAKKPDFTLYGYWRSGATWRVRLALALKGFHFGKDVEYIAINLVKGEQRDASYAKLNPTEVSASPSPLTVDLPVDRSRPRLQGQGRREEGSDNVRVDAHLRVARGSLPQQEEATP